MKLFLICAAAIFFQAANAQTFDYNHQIKWEEKPALHTTSQQFAASSAVGILDDRDIEYKLENKEIVLYNTYHRIYKINDDKGIEMFNKIYVPIYQNSVLSNLKARTILNSGKVVDVPSDKIKDIEEEGRLYKIFAMEGVEKGSEIEYTYTVKRPVDFFGTEIFQSSSTPYEKVYFTLAIPEHLKFDAKGFNGFKISSDSLIGDRRVIVGYDDAIKEMDEEKYAVRDPYLKRVEYKLSYNLSKAADVRIYTWKEFAKTAYSIYTTLLPKEEKPLESFADAIKLDKAKSEEQKILMIEDYIKSGINIDKNLIGEDAGAIDKIVKRKSSNEQGIIRLFANIFEKNSINYQLVFVGKRDEAPMDQQFENWNRVDETAFYFPSTNKYLSPTTVELRYPYIPFYWAGSTGLFLKGTSIGNFRTAVGSFAPIDMIPYENHNHNMEVAIRFDKTLDTLLISSKQILTGYGAANYRPIYTFLPKEKQDEANMQIIKAVAKSSDITNIKVENTSLNDYFDNKPLSISADIKSTELIEHAGDKLLLKIGEIIGPQEEMYQEKPRQLPIELPYPHSLDRKIVLRIPEGYKVKNLDDLNMSVTHKEGNKETMGFTSSYKLNGNNIEIIISENYKEMKYPLSQFEDFKKVINASADFNKIILVLEKV